MKQKNVSEQYDNRQGGETYNNIRMIKIVSKRQQSHSIIPIFRLLLSRHEIKETPRIDNKPMIRKRLPIRLRENSNHPLPRSPQPPFLLSEKILMERVVWILALSLPEAIPRTGNRWGEKLRMLLWVQPEMLRPEDGHAVFEILTTGPGFPPEVVFLEVFWVAVCEECCEECVDGGSLGEFIAEWLRDAIDGEHCF